MNLYIVSIAAYVTLALGSFWFFSFFRLETAILWWERSVGFPLLVFLEAVCLPFRGWRWLKRQRDLGIFLEQYGWKPTSDRQNDQLRVNSYLAMKARAMQTAFDNEVSARKVMTRREKMAEIRMAVLEAKKRFWTAYGVAKRLGFSVEGSYRNYLTK